jgi:replicative DNA helicase
MEELRHISEIAGETLQYIKDRKEGKIKSLRTGYSKLDESGIDGIEWGSIVGIGARMGVGKTAFSSCLIRGFLNPTLNDQDFDILDMNWEMAARVLLIRELSADLEKSYKHIVSAEGVVTDWEMDVIRGKLLNNYAKLPIYYVEKPKTPKAFGKIIRQFRDKADRKGRKLLVRVDHASLAEVVDGDQVRTLYNLLGEANEIKREDNMTSFIFLNQIKSEFEKRQENGSSKAFPVAGDIFGADALGQFAESIMILNKPSKYGITYYGNRPHGIQVQPRDIFCHCVKARNAPPDLVIHFAENFAHMVLEEL